MRIRGEIENKRRKLRKQSFLSYFSISIKGHVCVRKVVGPVDVFKILSKSPLKKLIAAQLQITKVEAGGI